jgi:hypothetical protein
VWPTLSSLTPPRRRVPHPCVPCKGGNHGPISLRREPVETEVLGSTIHPFANSCPKCAKQMGHPASGGGTSKSLQGVDPA